MTTANELSATSSGNNDNDNNNNIIISQKEEDLATSVNDVTAHSDGIVSSLLSTFADDCILCAILQSSVVGTTCGSNYQNGDNNDVYEPITENEENVDPDNSIADGKFDADNGNNQEKLKDETEHPKPGVPSVDKPNCLCDETGAAAVLSPQKELRTMVFRSRTLDLIIEPPAIRARRNRATWIKTPTIQEKSKSKAILKSNQDQKRLIKILCNHREKNKTSLLPLTPVGMKKHVWRKKNTKALGDETDDEDTHASDTEHSDSDLSTMSSFGSEVLRVEYQRKIDIVLGDL